MTAGVPRLLRSSAAPGGHPSIFRHEPVSFVPGPGGGGTIDDVVSIDDVSDIDTLPET